MLAMLRLALMAAMGAVSMSTTQATAEQALIVHFEHQGRWADFFAWEPKVEDAIAESGGDYDGNELAVDGTEGSIYMYGADAERLLEVAKPHLLSARFLHNIVATLRYGDVSDPSAKERKVSITP